MSFSATFGDHLLIEGAATVFGTAMLGAAFGTVKSARLQRTGNVVELEDGAGALRAVIIANPGLQLTLECAFDRTVAPGPFAVIQFPLLGIAGRVMPGVEITWELGGERGLRISVSQWDSLVNSTAYRVNPVTGDEIALDDVAPAVISCDSMVITCDSTEITCDSR